MELVRKNTAARALVDAAQRAGERLALVPTMGYLHEGHRDLITRARAECDRVVVSIFVNPTQFGPNEDFARYPRDLERDLALCRDAGADAVYAPEVEELYPFGPGTLVVPPAALSSTLCGAFRPGHFDGVATVVAKLFALWQPQRAYFGLKDFQQTAVIARMVADLCFPVELVRVPTVREPDGLAMSSRNTYLSESDRATARALPRALAAGYRAAHAPGASTESVCALVRQELERAGITPQYVALVDPLTLAPSSEPARGVLAIAATVGATRLIDNLLLAEPSPFESLLESAP
ncbi:MAG TPA: pantoate--beta-alanine ligase [Oscillatoriaceae cyanobacterium]